jgi:signal transduction histidine kinase
MLEKSALSPCWQQSQQPCSDTTAASFGAALPATTDLAADPTHEALGIVSAALRDAQGRLLKSYAALAVAQDAAARRERFIAVLVHDLRNSLQSIAFGTEHLRQSVADERSLVVVARIERSNDRMAELVQNVLDLMRGRHSGGIPVALKQADGLASELQHVIAEMQSAHVRNPIEVELAVSAPVVCDRHRIAQLLGNLLSNAVTHGAADSSIQVRIVGNHDGLEISVANSGPTIPEERLESLFEAFSHGEDSVQGLGLGLYISAAIAKAHGAALTVLSAGGRTCFTFRMPCAKDLSRN